MHAYERALGTVSGGLLEQDQVIAEVADKVVAGRQFIVPDRGVVELISVTHEGAAAAVHTVEHGTYHLVLTPHQIAVLVLHELENLQSA